MPRISIIIRSRNEEKWIVSCLDAIMRQDEGDFEIILVDNASTDRTVEKASAYPVTVVSTDMEPFRPGLAINLGIRAARGEDLVILSAHCIPVNTRWLGALARTLDEHPGAAGVYGRQEPLPFTNELDKRDLINLFGLDRKVQVKDPFFHNANSMIRRQDWERLPFDEQTLHIEDRIWAQQVLALGRTIVYEPEASVYHYHGVNQGRNLARARGIVRILERIHAPGDACTIEGLDIAAIIPSRGEPVLAGGRPLIERTIRHARDARFVDRVFVATDNAATAAIARELGCTAIMRPESLSTDLVGLTAVYQFALERMVADEGYRPDLLVLAEEIYPFRPPGLFDRLIEGLLQADYDSVIAACEEYGSIWRKEPEGDLTRLDEGSRPSKLKEPLYRGLMGAGCVTHPGIVLSGSKLGNKVGLVSVGNGLTQFALRSEMDHAIFDQMEAIWNQRHGDAAQRAQGPGDVALPPR
jgi:GT2 family glycosyltransferase